MSTNIEKITEVFAFVSVDEKGEGLVGMTMEVNGRETFMPFVCADKARMQSLKPLAKKIAEQGKIDIRIIHFSNRKIIETIYPGE